jgi:hypothetical protein
MPQRLLNEFKGAQGPMLKREKECQKFFSRHQNFFSRHQNFFSLVSELLFKVREEVVEEVVEETFLLRRTAHKGRLNSISEARTSVV